MGRMSTAEQRPWPVEVQLVVTQRSHGGTSSRTGAAALAMEGDMSVRNLILGALAAGGGAVIARRKLDPRRIHGRHDDPTVDRWHVVFVNRPQDAVAPDGQLPAPLAELGDAVEVQVRRAAGDRGTALAARVRTPVPAGLSEATTRILGTDPRQAVRTALRHSKQLVETGEVLSPDKPGSTRLTLTNLPLELATRRARAEGRL
ncbi:MAG: hypothetical protein QOI36_4360 [Pseudonocardiales bacterium]|nr:hypothetical protein [Pseudonocardiales bacterium]